MPCHVLELLVEVRPNAPASQRVKGQGHLYAHIVQSVKLCTRHYKPMKNTWFSSCWIPSWMLLVRAVGFLALTCWNKPKAIYACGSIDEQKKAQKPAKATLCKGRWDNNKGHDMKPEASFIALDWLFYNFPGSGDKIIPRQLRLKADVLFLGPLEECYNFPTPDPIGSTKQNANISCRFAKCLIFHWENSRITSSILTIPLLYAYFTSILVG